MARVRGAVVVVDLTVPASGAPGTTALVVVVQILALAAVPARVGRALVDRLLAVAASVARVAAAGELVQTVHAHAMYTRDAVTVVMVHCTIFATVACARRK